MSKVSLILKIVVRGTVLWDSENFASLDKQELRGFSMDYSIYIEHNLFSKNNFLSLVKTKS